MNIALLIIKFISVLLTYLQEKKLIELGEANIIKQLLDRATVRAGIAKKVSDNGSTLDDSWLQPDKFIKRDTTGRVLQSDELHKHE